MIKKNIEFFYSKWEFLLFNILTLGKPEEKKILKNFSLLIIIGSGIVFSQLQKGLLFHQSPEMIKSLLNILLILNIFCFSKVLIFDLKNVKINDENKKSNITVCDDIFLLDNIIINKNFATSSQIESRVLKKEIYFDDDLVNKLRGIVNDLKIKEKKEYSFLLVILKDSKFSKQTDILLLKKFASIFDMQLTPQFFSQTKNEIKKIEETKSNLNVSRRNEQYIKLYYEIKERL